MHILISLGILVIVAAILYWAIMKIVGAFGLPPQIVTVVQVVFVLVVVFAILSQFGLLAGVGI